VPYHAAQALTAYDHYLSTYPVTRAEYLEHGSGICRRKFGGPEYSVNPPGFQSGIALTEMDDDERERRYALGLLDKGKHKGKKREQDEEVVSGNWGGRRRRAMGAM
jgi:actin-related protein 6